MAPARRAGGGAVRRLTPAALRAELAACTACVPHLPLGPRPVLHISTTARILIIGQAPSRSAHESGVPFADRSGERLAGWLGIDEATLHDPAKVAIVSMGLCYPGKASGGDKPPRRECAPLWHRRLFNLLPADRLTILLGTHAQAAYLPQTRGWSLAERVRRHAEFAPFFPLPHPAWRSALFAAANPWFEAEVLPALRHSVFKHLAETWNTWNTVQSGKTHRPGTR